MKYDTTVDLGNPATSNTKLLLRVPKKSKVLEIGSAAGSMTKIMAQTLGCQVSIIEYDPKSYAVAREIAADGFCGDAEETGWENYYRGQQFDIIMMSNVLEHLRDPLSLLKRSKAFLKEDGHILISIPNAAHNDVILNLIQDDFHYTPMGLLDDTHIHLFAEKNYYQLISDAGLHIQMEDRVYLDTCETEQDASWDGVPTEAVFWLKRRRNGEVYQLVADLTVEGEDLYFEPPRVTPAEKLLSYRQIIEKQEKDIEDAVSYARKLEKDISHLKEKLESGDRLSASEHESWAKTEQQYISDIEELKQTLENERILNAAESSRLRHEIRALQKK